MSDDPRILILDIETAPNVAYVWGLFKQNIDPKHVEASSYVLCWSAKWLGQHAMSHRQSRDKDMLPTIHALLGDADIVVHYNGTKFDIPTLNKEFLKAELPPPAPYKQVDLFLAVKAAFRFESNKLDYVARSISIGEKMAHRGFDLWVKCMKGDAQAWRELEKYNRQDVLLTEKLYLRLRPWIVRHPNLGLNHHGICCPKCGSAKVQQRGVQVAKVRTYHRYQCQACASWFRGNSPLDRENESERGVAI